MFAGIRSYLGVLFFGASEDNSLETIHRNTRYSLIPEAVIYSVFIQIFIPWVSIWVHENYGWKGIAITTFWLAPLIYAVLLNRAIAKYQKEIRDLIAKGVSIKANSTTSE